MLIARNLEVETACSAKDSGANFFAESRWCPASSNNAAARASASGKNDTYMRPVDVSETIQEPNICKCD